MIFIIIGDFFVLEEFYIKYKYRYESIVYRYTKYIQIKLIFKKIHRTQNIIKFRNKLGEQIMITSYEMRIQYIFVFFYIRTNILFYFVLLLYI